MIKIKWKCCGVLMLIFLLSAGVCVADEGMWLLPRIEKYNIDVMDSLGLELSADQLYSINQPSLKDAIVLFNGSCTGEIVSPNGLLFTNYHCGYDYIQKLSTLANNYLEEGFWAENYNDEIPNPGLSVQFLKSIEEVTDEVFKHLSDTMNAEQRSDQIASTIKQIEQEAEQDSLIVAEVKSCFSGNEYYLCVYREYPDVRLVGVPPASIGRFGYEHDNWEWPRHTGDFGVFRVYAAPDGAPAEYSTDNIPLHTEKYLNISLQGFNNSNFSVVMGYPGVTYRHKTSFKMEETMEVTNTLRIKIRGLRQEILMEAMQSNPEIAIKYASKYARSSNYWKYAIGQNEGIYNNKLLEQLKRQEHEFNMWVDDDSLRTINYGNVLSNIESIYLQKRITERNFRIISEALFRACELIDFTSDFSYLNVLMQSGIDRSSEVKQEASELQLKAHQFYKNYDLQTDMLVSKAMLETYFNMVNESDYPQALHRINKRFKGNVDRMVEKLYKSTLFTDSTRVFSLLHNPDKKILARDYGFKLARSIYGKYVAEYSQLRKLNKELAYNEYLYMKGRLEKNPDSFQYPDANLMMRLSYGTIEPYWGSDSIFYNEYTYLDGVIELANTDAYQHTIHPDIRKLYDKNDYGNYATDSVMPVCFITNNDISGGNSGSPVLNNKGELVGIAFDSNWDALISDFQYKKEYQRCISVDIRYVLFIIDKFAGAKHILDELELTN